MLQYNRRNKIAPSISQQQNKSNSTPLLTYCNWSYAPDYHIDLDTLKEILHSVNEEYIPYYLRIFNETPYRVVEAFLEQYEISKSSLESIYQDLLNTSIQVKRLE